MMEDDKMIQGLVSIAIPAYKRKWLSSAIESVLNQDYGNIELIIVDDHSPYNLKEVVEPYLADKRVSYYYNEKNIGKESVANNWNKCLEYVRGEFFVLLCDDDVLMPDFVSELLCLVQKYPQCNIFHGRREFYYEEAGTSELTESWPEYESFEEFVQAKAEGLRKHTITEFLYRSSSIVKEKYVIFPVGYFSDDASILKIVKEGLNDRLIFTINHIFNSFNFFIVFQFTQLPFHTIKYHFVFISIHYHTTILPSNTIFIITIT